MNESTYGLTQGQMMSENLFDMPEKSTAELSSASETEDSDSLSVSTKDALPNFNGENNLLEGTPQRATEGSKV
jgi:hypothetical protein